MTQVKNYIYVFVRKDLSLPQIAVQACHACIEITRTHVPTHLEHPHLVLFGIRDEQKLCKILAQIESLDIYCRPFFEPDLDNSLTAFATEPVLEHQKFHFSKFQLLRVKETQNV